MWTRANEIERSRAAAELAAWLPGGGIDVYRFRRVLGIGHEQAVTELRQLVLQKVVGTRETGDGVVFHLVDQEPSRAYRGLLDLPPSEDAQRKFRPYWDYVPRGFVDVEERSDG